MIKPYSDGFALLDFHLFWDSRFAVAKKTGKIDQNVQSLQRGSRRSYPYFWIYPNSFKSFSRNVWHKTKTSFIHLAVLMEHRIVTSKWTNIGLTAKE